MYLATVLLLMLVLPAGSVLLDPAFAPTVAVAMPLVGKWFVFWACGWRLLLAGLRQFFQPRFTAEAIFGLTSDDALPLVRELGVANFATGAVGILSLLRPDFTLPVAVTSTIFYGIAGIRHAAAGHRTGNENIAMISDLFVAAILTSYVGAELLT